MARAKIAAFRLLRRWTMDAGARGVFPSQVMRAERQEPALPVVMCMWNRPERLTDVLEMIRSQECDTPLRLEIWNNNRRNHKRLAEIVRSAPLGGALAGVRLTTSLANIGGMGRFYILKKLRRQGLRGPAVLLDDDQDVTPRFVSDLLGRYRPHSIHGVWAWSQKTSYWDRVEVADREPATYVGTGGCVIDSSLVEQPGFFSRLPDQYLFVEDLWMSFVATWLGWSLRKIDTPYEFVQEELNQHHQLTHVKDDFFAYLQTPEARAGWEPS